MGIEYPIFSFSMKKGLEENKVSINNGYGKSTAREIKTPLFCITESKGEFYENCKMYSDSEYGNALWFSAVLEGSVVCCSSKEEKWLAGNANLLTCREVKAYSCFSKNRPVRTISFMLAPDYLERMASWHPDLFESIANRFSGGKSFKLFPENLMCCPEIRRTLNNILDYKAIGNAAILYLDAQIQEVLSLFLCNTSQKYCSACSCYSARDNEKLFCVKAIIEQQYQNPPSLHQLASMVGTNISKIKAGFKELFGTTVFEYLFDYRMEIACKYLLDTDKPVQEIADNLGYEYPSHFSTAFKRKFGLSPLEYRNIAIK